MVDPLFKVGDTVVIKDQYDRGMDADSYPFWFDSHAMLETYGGKLATITRVDRCNRANICNEPAYNGDDFHYKIDVDQGDWSWHSSMFKNGPSVRKHVESPAFTDDSPAAPWSFDLHSSIIKLNFV